MGGIAQLLTRAFQYGPRTVPLSLQGQGAGAYAGRTAVASGIATATVSTRSVNSDSIVLTTWHSSVGSNVAQVVKVGSVVDKTSLLFTVTPAPVGTDFIIGWEIVDTSQR